MIGRLKNWLDDKFSSAKSSSPATPQGRSAVNRALKRNPPPRRPATPSATSPNAPETVELDPHVEGQIEDLGPGKNVLIRNKYVREDAGTHDSLKILDDSLLETDEESGRDPYNSGKFDRPKNWDSRRK